MKLSGEFFSWRKPNQKIHVTLRIGLVSLEESKQADARHPELT
ncbi:hypothetical protein GGP72_000392 [Salinibacter ruber]|nr:hypothetical protein [Salinibacter ruber]MCS3679783.1 hypothetical protein [Salinibacter ruber]MCS4118464.1 hypothetical protein [Salinibacter ruber]MCS4170789.1 hypothetical protein [Salinibacter ruber]